MASNFKKDWLAPLGLLGLGLIPLVLSLVKVIALADAAANGIIPPDHDAPHHYMQPLPIVLHIIPGMIFVLTGPLQFAPAIRRRMPRLHRMSGRLYLVSGAITVGAALWMNQFYPAYGGWPKYLGVLGFGLGFFICAAIALRAILRRDVARHQRWMTRTIALGLGPGTQSLIAIPVALTVGLGDAAIGLVVVLGFSGNLAFAEWLIRRRQRR